VQATESATGTPYEHLVQRERVHGSLYTDEQIFAEELARIWYTTWVFVGHLSEVPQPNDYVRKNIGPQEVIMTRDRDGDIHLLLNRCAHRGSIICAEPRGNSSAFRCPYHGWTFRNTGKLLGYPFRQGYERTGPGLDLAEVPRVRSYQGFVFASLSPTGRSLEQHLGPAAAAELDRLAGLSPEGELILDCGWVTHQFGANWKLLFENDADGYHPQFAHQSIFSASHSPIGDLYTDRSPVVARDIGNGHSLRDMRPVYRSAHPLSWAAATESKLPDYVASMRARYGDEADQVLTDGPPNIMIFPNLAIMDIHISAFQPVAPNLSLQHVTAVQFKGAPDLNLRQLQQTVASVGPAGMFLADDAEMHERVQRGLAARQPEWVDVRRGLNREHTDDQGFTVSTVTDETGIRAFWREYLRLMTTGEMPAA
jgi:phenylpropionate dioxygenase-like ring-hydroxylating dioxygenase large terminal subunit